MSLTQPPRATPVRPAMIAGLTLALSLAGAVPSQARTTLRSRAMVQGEAFRYVHVNGPTINMSGSDEDVREAKAVGGREDANYLWVRRGDRAFVIRDAALLAELEEAEAPMLALADAQSKLGHEQSLLGESQRQVGEIQRKLGERQGELGNRMAKQWNDRAGSTSLSEEMEALGAEQHKLSLQQARMGRDQASLGQRQAEMGRRQAIASRDFQRRLAELVDDAEKRGLIEPR